MIIEINDNKKIGEICREFSDHFPFLKIEFFDEPHNWQEPTSLKHILPQQLEIGEVRNKQLPGVIEIHSYHKTGSVEQEFLKHFGLNIQIFRRQGDEWIQTAGTDELVLEEQNELGRKSLEENQYGTDIRFDIEKRL
ncbi:MAG: hypothetical protein C5B59_03735 [Bacteroidetes bacterium]|nr:MAG: hypothetical protein C5B59_03735 [Bacteroidota bacterium]